MRFRVEPDAKASMTDRYRRSIPRVILPMKRFLVSPVYLAFFVLLGCFAVSDVASAQDSEQFQMPTDPSVWLNSSPLTSEMLAGKAAVLYFYEET